MGKDAARRSRPPETLLAPLEQPFSDTSSVAPAKRSRFLRPRRSRAASTSACVHPARHTKRAVPSSAALMSRLGVLRSLWAGQNAR
jgi:hypothetical protein